METTIRNEEHPILRKYVPSEFGTETAGLTRQDYREMVSEMADVYGVPIWVIDASDLDRHELLLKELRIRVNIPNRVAFEKMSFKKKRLEAIREIIGEDLYTHFWDPYQIVGFIMDCQSSVLWRRREG